MQWINIKDKAPEDGQKVIYYFAPLGIFMGYYKRCKGEEALYGTHCFESAHGFLTDDVTHWMPVPEAPGNAQQQVQPDNSPKMCEECGQYPADLPSNLCCGCDAYREHHS